MRLIEVIFSIIYQRYIIAGEVHVQGNIGMMGRVIVHQGYKKAGGIHQSQQGKKKIIMVS